MAPASSAETTFSSSMKLVRATISTCGCRALISRDRGDAVLDRHDDVHQDDVGSAVGRGPDRLLAVGGLAHDLHVVDELEQSAKAAPDDRVIVDDEDADPCPARSCALLPARARAGSGRTHA